MTLYEIAKIVNNKQTGVDNNNNNTFADAYHKTYLNTFSYAYKELYNNYVTPENLDIAMSFLKKDIDALIQFYDEYKKTKETEKNLEEAKARIKELEETIAEKDRISFKEAFNKTTESKATFVTSPAVSTEISSDITNITFDIKEHEEKINNLEERVEDIEKTIKKVKESKETRTLHASGMRYPHTLKEYAIRLRKLGKTYQEISDITGIGIGTVASVCVNANVNKTA